MTILSSSTAVPELLAQQVDAAIFCPLTSPDTAALTADGAYTDDVLRIVRGTPNAEELAALVAALLLTRRAHETRGSSTSSDEEHHRPSRLREGYPPPGAWTAGL